MSARANGNGRLHAALTYVHEHHWRVVPLQVRGKAPLLKDWVAKASRDPEVLASWWRRWPKANVGIATGEGLLVVDADGAEGEATLERLGLAGVATLAVRTAKGRHLYFSGEGPTRVRVAPGLDTRGAGGLVVAPPSVHPSGTPYEWLATDQLAPLPKSLRSLLGGGRPLGRGAAAPLPDHILEGERNSTLLSLAGSMRRRNVSEEAILAALREENTRKCEPPLPDDEVARIARSGGSYEPDASLRAAQTGEDAHGRPAIVVRHELTRETEEAIAAIKRLPDHGLYVRGNQLVRVARYREVEDAGLWKERPLDAPAITTVDLDALRGLMDRAACWLQLSPKGHAHPTYPPEPVVRQVLSRRLELGFPPLEQVTETPLLTPAGTVTAEGYDARTGILYLPRGEGFLPADLTHLSPKQLREVARAAAEELSGVVDDFPFTDRESWTVYLAGLLTILARPAIRGPVPPISVEAPTPGTGKTLLVKLISKITTDRLPGITVMTENEEMRKRITSICLDGPALVLLDNVSSGVLKSNVLAALFTSETWEDRLLGINEQARVPNLSQWFITGNSISFSGDLARRVLPISLDSDLEDPENRPAGKFKHPDLLRYAEEVRPQLVRAGLTLLRAFHLAGRPQHGKARMGSFEWWDDLVRSAVVWATGYDPAASDDPLRGRGRVRAEANADREDLATLLSALRQTYRAKTGKRTKDGTPIYRPVAFTVAAVYKRYQEWKKAGKTDELFDALPLTAADRHGFVTPASIGNALRLAHGKRAGRLKLEKVSAKLGGRTRAEWQVVSRSPQGVGES